MNRKELEQLTYQYSNPFEILDIFETKLAAYFGSPYAVLTDSCTHALELCFRILKDNHRYADVPTHTYMSVPMMLNKLDIDYNFREESWKDFYQIGNYPIYDAAVLWRQNSYIPGSYMCISFQQKKHVKIGRGGAILLDNKDHYTMLRKMRYDGRDLSKKHVDDNVEMIGYHYYMTPEDAALGIMLFDQVVNNDPKLWSWQDYKNLKEYKVFENVKLK
jgi:dTDP-4-amino-4,6-dideoxygalactose transaminase